MHTLKEEEGGVLGSALLAMVAAGIQPDVPSAARRCVQIERTFHPNPDDFPRYDALFNLFTDLHDRLQAPFDRLSEIE